MHSPMSHITFLNNKMLLILALISISFLIVTSCTSDTTKSKNTSASVKKQPINHHMAGFEKIPSSSSNIHFRNDLDIEQLKSIVYYINVYNGGGVALGDINNDDLIDIYFTGNLVGNKLYLNKGNLEFEDITESAGVGCDNKWSTGTSFADVNNDGLLDLYVCHSYDDDNPDKRANSLFINKGGNVFEEQAKAYGLADIGYSIHSSFLDYDKDGDLDMFLGNAPRHESGDVFFNSSTRLLKNFKNPTNELWSDKLFRNNGNGTFSDVTKEAGIFNYGFMLGVSVADYNDDNLPDIYVAVDHGTPDYFYINNGDGTFRNEIYNSFKHISLSSMGTDAADINNDSKVDILTLDMLSFDNFSEKTQMASMDVEGFNASVEAGLHYQYMRNMLQLNNGNGKFTEIGQMAGIHKSDWAWSIMAADFNNNGWKDLFITNGFYRSIMHKDLNKKFQYIINRSDKSKHKAYAQELVRQLPQQKNRNVLFKNKGNYTFSNVAGQTGVDEYGFSSGAAYADLDNDGDLDLVVNNTDQEASILRNKQREEGEGNYISLKFKYKNKSPDAGTKIEITSCGQSQFYERTYARGYQSSYTGPTLIGLGACTSIENLTIIWPDGKKQEINDASINAQTIVKYNPNGGSSKKQNSAPLFTETTKSNLSPAFMHKENTYDDYKHQVLLPHKMSQFGPFISKGDVNGDGFEDFFVGGAISQSGAIYLYDQNSKTYTKNDASFRQDALHEDLGSVFFDLENDGDLDLYIVSGGNEYPINNKMYRDRLYVNDGKGNFSLVKEGTPKIKKSGSCVIAEDFDKDGYTDLFVGTRHHPHKYPYSSFSYLIRNEKGKLTPYDKIFSEETDNMGMVTDACFADINNDNVKDLIVVGEWMPVNVFINTNGKFVNKTEEYGLSDSQGWWNCIDKTNVDGDGDMDFVLGNLGLNYKYKASPEKPFHIYAGDFDKNGTNDIVLGQYYENDLFPVRGRQCSSEQMPSLADKFPTYNDFGKADLKTVYGEYMDEAYHLKVNTFKSSVLINEGGKFKLKPLPSEAQFAPINDVLIKDINNDQLEDIIAGGNLFVSEVETGRADSGTGVVLINLGDGNYKSVSSKDSGLFIDQDVKSLQLVNNNLVVGNNNNLVQMYELNK